MPPETVPTHRLERIDRAALELHFLKLDADDRRLRFGSALGDEAIREYVERIDFATDELFGARDDFGELTGVVHAAFTGSAAELGLSVLPGYRGQGLGGALFERAIVHLRNRGVSVVFVHCLAENQAMMHLARKNGMRIAYDGGESQARQELAPATPATILTEWVLDQVALNKWGQTPFFLIDDFSAPRKKGE